MKRAKVDHSDRVFWILMRRLLDSWRDTRPTSGPRSRSEAFPGDGFVPRYFHRDRDAIYGRAFTKKAAALGIERVISARRSPWQNPYAERVIGSIRRECTDHVIALGERHLVRVLRSYATYYNESRTHLSLDRNSPSPRLVDGGPGNVIALPHLGGLHHRYARAA